MRKLTRSWRESCSEVGLVHEFVSIRQRKGCQPNWRSIIYLVELSWNWSAKNSKSRFAIFSGGRGAKNGRSSWWMAVLLFDLF